MARKVIIALIRHDLRIHDHAPFHAAHTAANGDVTHLMPLYVFDERHIELSGLPGYKREGPEARTNLCKFWRTGAFRARFLTEGVYDLRDRLRRQNSDLLIRFGKIETVTANIVKALQNCGDEVKGVYMHKEFYHQEAKQDLAMEHLLLKLGVRVTFFDTVPMVDVRDLPFSIAKIPDVFTPFRKQVEALGSFGRPPLEMPRVFKPFPKPGPPKAGATSLSPSYGSAFDGKTAEDLIPFLLAPLKGSYSETPFDASHPRHPDSAFPYAGGETAALARLDLYFHQGASPPVARYKETRNQLLGHEYSTKFSPFSCLGMLSPRLIMQSLDEHERKHGATQNTYWVRFELLWRDYFLYISRKYGKKLFTLGGFEEVTDPRQSKIRTAPGWWHPWNANAGPNDKAIRFIEGRTGVPFIDANIMELKETGFMSNRGRQNVASFLTTDLRVDWRVGAEFFESSLIDYEPGANWGNWQYQAGCGNDPRASRQFNPIKQQNDYDVYGDYVKLWLPVLANVPEQRLSAPWTLSPQERAQYITGDYPATPLVEQSNWKPHYNRRIPPRPGHTQAELKAKNPGPRGGQPREGGREGGERENTRGGIRGRGSSSRGRGGHAQ